MSSAETASQETSSPSSIGLLPAPPDAATKHLEVGSNQKVLLDELGPMVVNSNGTLSRIASKSDLRNSTILSTRGPWTDHDRLFRRQHTLFLSYQLELSHILDWSTMTEAEQNRTLRVLGSRNQLRLAARADADASHSTEAQCTQSV
ncbi:hypothetical protein C8J55DRAFT_115916 [Lentinula edodes]|uniref:Uncharacterized protein n=1 Tax=Lentinula lateritia TaxID=40482 RepID=A0A9W9A9V3_9AGAR|nr:hypothetical protein C8J55DRAFT_115916 [Lentinula edodes]